MGRVVYILSSDEHDCYLQQLALSVYSLRQNSPQSRVTIVCDQATYELLNGSRGRIKEMADEMVIVDVPQWVQSNKMLCSRWVKTSLRKHIDGAYLMVDTDTIIIGDLESIWETQSTIACVSDMHESRIKNKWNSGVIFVADNPIAYEFYEKWNIEWQEDARNGRPTDQPSLHRISQSMDGVIEELPAKWNYQLCAGKCIPKDLKIAHYFTYDLKHKDNWLRRMLATIDLDELRPEMLSTIAFWIYSNRQAADQSSPELLHLTPCGYMYHQAPKLFAIIDLLVGKLYRLMLLIGHKKLTTHNS